MKKHRFLCLLLLCTGFLLFAACAPQKAVEIETTVPTTQETTAQTEPPTSTPPPETEATLPPIVLELTEEESEMLLKIGMAELGKEECPECVALVMRTVLNRVEAGGFGRSIYSVLHAQDQFTPVADGSYYKAEPNETCHTALDMVIRGWDESQGALYYEFCQGESWHSKNLQLLTEHCNTRFYK